MDQNLKGQKRLYYKKDMKLKLWQVRQKRKLIVRSYKVSIFVVGEEQEEREQKLAFLYSSHESLLLLAWVINTHFLVLE